MFDRLTGGVGVNPEWLWDRLDPLERQIAGLLLEGKTNHEICRSVFLSRARVQEYIRRVRVKTGARSTRGAIALLSEERESMALVHAFEQVWNGIAIVQDKTCVFVNRALAEICGYTVEEMTGMPFEKFIAPRYIDVQIQRYERRIAGEPVPSNYGVDIVRKGGGLVAVEVSAGGVVRWRGRPAIIGIARRGEQG